MTGPVTDWPDAVEYTADCGQFYYARCPLDNPAPIARLMDRVPRGKLATIATLREALARRHGTTSACPMTTGIFAWIAAHAAEEARQEGEERFTPWWRTLKTDVRPILDLRERTGVPIEACLFIGSSKIRCFTEDWDPAEMITQWAAERGRSECPSYA